MRLLAVFLLIILCFSSKAIAYPQDQLMDCVSSAKENPSLEGVSITSIENYCDCALELIVDGAKSPRDSGYECALKHFR